MSAPTRFDEADRPNAPAIADVTPAQRARGRRLAVVHRLHLQQLDLVHEALRRAEDGEREAGDVGRAIADLELAANYRRFGTLHGLVRSHFGYEEVELEAALGYHDVPL